VIIDLFRSARKGYGQFTFINKAVTMSTNIQSHNFELTDALREYTERRLEYALSRANGQIRRVNVRLYDANGPRGGIDKGCRIQVALKNSGDVVIENLESDLYVAIDRAADRVAWTVTRRLARRRIQVHCKLLNRKNYAADDIAISQNQN
jgi:putative sigma-54 modulation protein